MCIGMFSVARPLGERMLLVRCQPIAVGDPGGGPLVLQMQRNAFVVPRRPLPFGGDVQSGALHTLTHWDLAARVLLPPVASGGLAEAANVELTFVDAEVRLGDQFVVGDALIKRILDLRRLLVLEAGDGPADDADDNDGAADGGEGVDWEHVAVPRPRPSRVRSRTGATNAGAQATAEAMPAIGPAVDRGEHVNEVFASLLDEASKPFVNAESEPRPRSARSF